MATTHEEQPQATEDADVVFLVRSFNAPDEGMFGFDFEGVFKTLEGAVSTIEQRYEIKEWRKEDGYLGTDDFGYIQEAIGNAKGRCTKTIEIFKCKVEA